MEIVLKVSIGIILSVTWLYLGFLVVDELLCVPDELDYILGLGWLAFTLIFILEIFY